MYSHLKQFRNMESRKFSHAATKSAKTVENACRKAVDPHA